MTEPKVTECWVEDLGEGPETRVVLDYAGSWTRPAILLWREDYDAMRTELEELRAELRIKALDEMVAISQEAGEYDDEETK